MREIGVRDLKSGLSSVLRDVGHGEQVRVTVRGRPVADIVPVGISREDRRLRELVAEGKVSPPTRPLPSSPPKLLEGSRSPSAIVLAEREEER